MTTTSLVPQTHDLILYSGGSNVLNFYVYEPGGALYNDQTSQWNFEIYNKNSGDTLDTSPTGITLSPGNNGGGTGHVTVTLSKDLVGLLLNNDLTYQLSITENYFVLLRGGITVESKLS